MNKSILYQGADSYMVLEEESGEDYEYRMLFSNDIPCLLPVRQDVANQKGNLIYQTTGYRSLQEIYEKQWINYKEIKILIEEILAGMESMKRYLLFPESLLLDPDTVYWKTEERKVRFLYVPGYREDVEKQLINLMEYLMGRVNPEDVDGILLIWKTYTMLKESKGNLEEIRHKVMKGQEQGGHMDAMISGKKEHGLIIAKVPGQKKSFTLFQLGKMISAIILTALIAALGMLLFHIYYYGILIWKRNLLLVLLCLLFGDSIVLWKLFEKDKKEKHLKELFPLK